MMTDYSEICEIKVLDSVNEVNHLLKTFWILLNIFHSDGTCFFVLGKLYGSNYDYEEI